MAEPTAEDFVRLHQRIMDAAGSGSSLPGIYPDGTESDSPGAAFVESQSYQAWVARFPEGGPNQAIRADADPVTIRASIGSLGGMRSLVSSADASAGSLIPPDYRGLLEPGLVRPLRLRQLLTIVPVRTDLAEYTQELSRVSAAAPVSEAVQLAHTGDTTATKAEGGVTFLRVTVPIRTFALWAPITRRIVSDALGLRSYLDQYLSEDLAVEVEDQVIAGSGAGENFTGIVNTAGIQTAGPPGAGQTMLDSLRRGLKLVVLNGRTSPTGILLHPDDAETLATLKLADGSYIGRGPYGPGGIPSVWGIPLIETDAMPPGNAIVGDFRKAVLFDREDVVISVGTVGDDFIRNIVRVLAELRAGFGVLRPKAFVNVDLVA